MQTRHWQDYVTLIVGVWLAVSPYFLATPVVDATAPIGLGLAGWNAIVCGGAAIALAAAALLAFRAWEEWVTAVIGVWVFASPWLLGYMDKTGFTTSALVCGVILAAMGLWSAMRSGETTWV